MKSPERTEGVEGSLQAAEAAEDDDGETKSWKGLEGRRAPKIGCLAGL